MDEIRAETQLGATLIVRFSHEVSVSLFPVSDNIKQIEQTDNQSLAFTLSPTCNVPTLLQKILAEHEVDAIQTLPRDQRQ